MVASVPASQISLFCNNSFSVLQQMMWNVATVSFFCCCNRCFSDVAEQFFEMFHFCFFPCCSRFSLDVGVKFFVATDVFSNVALLVLEML